MGTKYSILVHVLGNKWLEVEAVYEEKKDEGTFTFDGLDYEVFWDYDGDEGWTVVDSDVPLLLEQAAAQIVER